MQGSVRARWRRPAQCAQRAASKRADGVGTPRRLAASRPGHGLSGLRRFATAKFTLKALDLAALRHDLPAYGLIAGDVGTVVLVHGDGEAGEGWTGRVVGGPGALGNQGELGRSGDDRSLLERRTGAGFR